MQLRIRSAVVILLVLTSRCGGEAAQGTAYPQLNLSSAELDVLEKNLEDPETRLSAIATLAEFSGFKLYQVGSVHEIDADRERDARRDRAVGLAKRHRDLETVSAALGCDDSRLQMWGLWSWRHSWIQARPTSGYGVNGGDKLPSSEEERAWHALVPRIRQLASESVHRSVAIDDLAMLLDENRDFLSSLIPKEKAANVILRLVHYAIQTRQGIVSPRDELFNEQLIRLLNDPDTQVRADTLACIGWNWNNAPMYQVRFNSAVATRVQELQRSADPEELRLANLAAEGLQKIGKIWSERGGNEQ